MTTNTTTEVDIYIPVRVTVKDQQVVWASTDDDESYVGDEFNAYNEEEDWHRDDDAEEIAERWLGEALLYASRAITGWQDWNRP